MNLENLLEKNKPFKNRHAGKRCFIIANGPSLNQQDLSHLKNEVTIVVNSFYRHPEYRELAPTYHMIADPAHWEQPETYFAPLMDAIQQAELPTKLFMPTGAIPMMSQLNRSLFLEPHFYHFDYSKQNFDTIDLSEGIPPFGQNVVVTSLMLAYFLGCNPIYLIGCDHSWWGWTAESYDQVRNDHFYAEPPGSKTIQDFLTFEQVQRAIARQRFEYQQLRHYGETNGFEVFNATAGGFLEDFPRASYESLFPKTGGGNGGGVSPALSPLRLGEAALALMKTEQFDAALVLLEKAAVLNTHRSVRVAGLDFARSLCLIKQGLIEQAWQAALQELVTNPSQRAQVGPLLEELEQQAVTGQENAALLDSLVASAALTPITSPLLQTPDALNQLGERFFEHNKLNDALTVFSELVEQAPDFAPAYNNLGVLYWQLGGSRKALQLFEALLAHHPGNRDAVVNGGEIYRALQQPEQARKLYEAYLGQHPEDGEVAALLAQLNETATLTS